MAEQQGYQGPLLPFMEVIMDSYGFIFRVIHGVYTTSLLFLIRNTAITYTQYTCHMIKYIPTVYTY